MIDTESPPYVENDDHPRDLAKRRPSRPTSAACGGHSFAVPPARSPGLPTCQCHNSHENSDDIGVVYGCQGENHMNPQLIWSESWPTTEFHAVVITTMIGSSKGISATPPQPTHVGRSLQHFHWGYLPSNSWPNEYMRVLRQPRNYRCLSVFSLVKNQHEWVLHRSSPVL